MCKYLEIFKNAEQCVGVVLVLLRNATVPTGAVSVTAGWWSQYRSGRAIVKPSRRPAPRWGTAAKDTCAVGRETPKNKISIN